MAPQYRWKQRESGGVVDSPQRICFEVQGFGHQSAPLHFRGETNMTNTTAVKTSVKDPVYGMETEKASAAGQTDHKGHTYYFCGIACKEKFDANPEKYLNSPDAAGKSCCGCCN
jgi:YHS domain-containing protein